MGDQLKFFPLLSLKEMALRTTAVLLWSDWDLLGPVLRNYSEVPFRTAEDRVTAKVSQLELPKLLKKQVSDVVRPVGLEIARWKKFHPKILLMIYLNSLRNRLSGRRRLEFNNINADVLSDFKTLCWTTAGGIDYQKTLKELRCDAFGVVELYEIACDYCLEDHIALLWEQISGEAKEYFSGEHSICLGLSFQWPYILKGEQSKLNEWSREEYEMNFNQYSFETSAVEGKKWAAKYFYQKLTLEEREASVMRSFPKVLESINLANNFDDPMGETFCYLLTLMTPEQQMEVLKAHPIHLFFCFFDIIWPDLFLENAPLIWKLLPPKDYARLQRVMVEKMVWKCEYSPALLRKLFISSPPGFKKCSLGHESAPDVSLIRPFLALYFALKDSESVKGLFRSLDAADRVKLVFDYRVLPIFVQSIIHDDGWPMVEMCLAECALYSREREGLMKRLEKALKKEDPEFVSQRLKRVYDFLDAPDSSSDDEERGQKRSKLENSSPE